VVIGKLFLVLLDAAVELVGQRVDRGVHILLDCIRVNGAAPEQDGGFSLVAQLFDGQDAMNVYYVVRVPDDAVELFLDVSLEGGSDIDMVAGDVQLHGNLLRTYLPDWNLLALARRRNAERLAIFGDGAPRDQHALA
jgi:hypothetical protein